MQVVIATILIWMCTTQSLTWSLSYSSTKGPPLPNKFHSPIDIVNFQLEALQQDDIYTVFKYASPANKQTTGPWQRFSQMVRKEPYGILVGHDRSEILMEWEDQSSFSLSSTYKCMDRVWSKKNINGAQKSEGIIAKRRVCREFHWSLSKQTKTEDPLFEGCWMVDGVFPK